MTMELASIIVLHSHIEFLMKVTGPLLALYSPKHFSILVWGMEM